MLKRFNKSYFYCWLIAVIFLGLSELGTRNAWRFSLKIQDVNYIFGYGIVFDLLAFLALIVGAIVWIRMKVKKQTK